MTAPDDRWAALMRRVTVCPQCFNEIHSQCHFTYNTYRCWVCGISVDGRVSTPPRMDRDEAAERHTAWERGE